MLPYIKIAEKMIPIVKPDRSILENLESAGIEVNYQCRDGLCGSCRCKLLAGKVSYQQPHLSSIQPGEVLICIAMAQSNIELKGI